MRPKVLLPGEARPVGWSCALFFCVFASAYLVRPVRDAMGVTAGTVDLPTLFAATLGLTVVLMPAISTAASRFARRRFLSIAYRSLAVSLLVFAVLLGRTPDPWVARAFFVWSSVVNLLTTALAWGFAADVFTRAQGVRLFALIGAGGTLGAIVGSLAASVLAKHAPLGALLAVAAVLLELAVRSAKSLPGGRGQEAPCSDGGTFTWVRRVVRDPFVLALVGYMALFTITSTALYLEQARIVKATLDCEAERAALFAEVDLAANAIALVLQMFVVSRLLGWIGVGPALAVLPVLTLLAFVLVRTVPVLGVLVGCQVVRRATDLALSKPAREVLFTVAPREDRYKTKSFIDTFVYRTGDAAGAWSLEGLAGPVLVGIVAALCVAWAAVALVLGKRFGRDDG